MLILRLFSKRLHVSEQKPLFVAARVNIVPKKPYFALKTGEKFAQTFGLTVRSPIMKIWVLLFIKSRDMVSNVTAKKAFVSRLL